MLTIAQGVSADPTLQWEDDFQDTVPCNEDAGRIGVRGNSSLLPLDVCDLLKSQRFGFEMISHKNKKNSGPVDLLNVFDFVPDLVMGLLISLFPDETQLHRLLSQDWVRTWDGWQEWEKSNRNEGSIELSDDTYAEELVRRLIAISMDHVVTNYPTDAERRRELLMSCNLEVKHGDGARNNCLTDSLLQCLLFHKIIKN